MGRRRRVLTEIVFKEKMRLQKGGWERKRRVYRRKDSDGSLAGGKKKEK